MLNYTKSQRPVMQELIWDLRSCLDYQAVRDYCEEIRSARKAKRYIEFLDIVEKGFEFPELERFPNSSVHLPPTVLVFFISTCLIKSIELIEKSPSNIKALHSYHYPSAAFSTFSILPELENGQKFMTAFIGALPGNCLQTILRAAEYVIDSDKNYFERDTTFFDEIEDFVHVVSLVVK